MIQRLVCLGSALVDVVLDVPHLPERGGDVLGTQRGRTLGGAFNVMQAAVRLGLPCVYAGPHGTGPFGDLVRATLEEEGIEIATAQNPALDTGWTVALIEPDAERTFVTVTGADGIVEPDSLRDVEYRDGDAAYVSGYDLAYENAGAAIAGHVENLPDSAFVAFDPGPLAAEIAPDRLAPVLARADLVSLNEREAGLLDLRGLRPDAVVVVRQGAQGATIHRAGAQPVLVPATPLSTVANTTGAGDTHVGANLAGLSRGLDWPEAVLFANRAAAHRLKNSVVPFLDRSANFQLEG